MAFEDDLLALERRVLAEAAGNFLLAVAELRDMLTKGAPGITRKLVALAIPDIEVKAKAGVLEGFALGGQRALDLVHSVDSPVDTHGRFQADIVSTQPPGALTTPLDGLDELVADAHRRSVLLVRGGADIETPLSPIFGAATTTRSRIETQINAASNTAALMVGEAARTPMVWEAERDACVYCLALAGHVVERPGDQFPRADLYAEPPRSQPIVQQPPLHPHCRCQLSILVDRSYSDALQREAQRSILRGFALPSESNAVRIRAAQKLLDTDPVAPKSVKAFAAKAIKAGRFPTRDVPTGDPRLVIRG